MQFQIIKIKRCYASISPTTMIFSIQNSFEYSIEALLFHLQALIT